MNGILHILVVAYNRPYQLQSLINQFLVQTCPYWKMYICYDGPAPAKVNDIISGYDDPRIHFYCSKVRNGQYGHPNRRKMLEKLAGQPEDFVLLTNDDNYYPPVFVEYVMRMATKTVGIVYYDTVHSHFQYKLHKPQLKRGYIDMGALIVRYPIAKAVGFTHNNYDADGIYAEECAKLCRANNLDVCYIEKPIFVHN